MESANRFTETQQGLRTFLSLLLLLCIDMCHSYVVGMAGRQNFAFLDEKQAEFAQSLKGYDIAVPQRVNEAGHFVSHQVHHTLDSSIPHRQKRATTQDDSLHFMLTVDNKDLHMSVSPNHKLFSPGFVIERRNNRFGNLSDVVIERYRGSLCHYVGQLVNQSDSQVAVATCHGLHGFLRTRDGEYFIEPVKGHDYKSGGQHPHLIYKRSALPAEYDIARAHQLDIQHSHDKDDHSSCGVHGNGKSEEEERNDWEKETRHNDMKSPHRRHKRSISLERHVETLVVVDTKMVEYYRDEDVTTYVLTIMNMVSTLYHDSTIGNAVNIVLVKLMLLAQPEKDLKISHHADNTLNSFCQWQKHINAKDEKDPHHHDVAVLLTRYNICTRMNEPCSTLGLSQVSGMCQPHRSCNVNEDTGLALGYTVAHELGHNFGMNHDTDKNGCASQPGHPRHVMAPQLNAESSSLIWSNCSRQAMTSFLDRDWGFCLDDEPSDHPFEFPVLPPGVMYDVNHQCRLQYGPEAKYCEGIDDVCTTLWCQVDNRCLTRLEAAASGTLCGNSGNQWCFGGCCVTINEKPQAIHGEWGQWTGWTDCSRTCGAGLSYKERHCNNPPPTNGGNYCLGERKRYRICNTELCDDRAASFREQQCSDFNRIEYKGKFHQWVPVQTGSPCQLNCKPKNMFFSVMLRDMVKDGTPCRSGIRDMCINGRCKHVGCDWEINSNAKEDLCGVCHGDGSTCKIVKQEFKEERGRGYVEAKVIPSGARNIRVEEVAEAKNYLAVRNDRGEYYLNGHWFIQWSGDYKVAGTVIQYRRDGNKESFNAPGPLKEDLHIMLLFQDDNPGVTFEYTVPNGNTTEMRKREFFWKYMDWTHCTSSCGGGMQRSEVVCMEKEMGMVDDFYCDTATKPDDLQRMCNEHMCPARWWVGPWQHCSVTCGNNGIHRRTVMCVRTLGPDSQMALDDFECEGLDKPNEIEPCHHKDACPDQALWRVRDWSDTCHGDPCSVRTREVECENPTIGCNPNLKPAESQQCVNISCGSWTVSPWSPCTRTCGQGIQYRSVTCEGGHRCASHLKPTIQQDCEWLDCNSASTSDKTKDSDRNYENDDILKSELNAGDVKVYGDDAEASTKSPSISKHHMWIPQFWGECSKPCGGGTKTRSLRCFDKRSMKEVGGTACSSLPRPQTQQACGRDACTQTWRTSGWMECSATCGQGHQTRDVTCPGEDQCDLDTKPEVTQPCSLPECNTWQAGDWQQCSKTCGGGSQVREVHCVNKTTQQSATECDPDNKPDSTQDCNTKSCPGSCKGDVMSYQICRTLKRRGKCKDSIVKNKCCRTCHPKKRGETITGSTS